MVMDEALVKEVAAPIGAEMADIVLKCRHAGLPEAEIMRKLESVFDAVIGSGVWTKEAVDVLKYACYEAADRCLSEKVSRIDHAAAESQTQH